MPNTYTSLRYHMIFSTRNREPFLVQPFRERMHAYLGGCLRRIGGVPLEIGGVSDHVHLLTGLKPTHCVAEVLQTIKKASSEWAHEMGCDKFHWQDGYSAFTVGRKGINALRRYIATQEEHHQTRTFEEEYREFLRLNGISFDERFLL